MHIVLLAPAGDQPALNAATALWREQFVTALVKRTGAIVADVTTDTQPAAPPVTAPHAPPVPNIEINTPTPSGPVTPGPDHPISLPIDTALFQPDTAEWAVDLDTVKADLAPIVAAWQAAHGDIVIMVSGHCARFGGRAGAITLSKQRAAKVADVVRSLGVTVDPSNVTGIGFDAPQPYPQDPMSYKNRAVLVVARTE